MNHGPNPPHNPLRDAARRFGLAGQPRIHQPGPRPAGEAVSGAGFCGNEGKLKLWPAQRSAAVQPVDYQRRSAIYPYLSPTDQSRYLAMAEEWEQRPERIDVLALDEAWRRERLEEEHRKTSASSASRRTSISKSPTSGGAAGFASGSRRRDHIRFGCRWTCAVRYGGGRQGGGYPAHGGVVPGVAQDVRPGAGGIDQPDRRVC